MVLGGGGIFDRMVRMMKRCLKEMIGQAKLSYDELLTDVMEVESIISSRLLSYVTMDDMEEPFTPSQLLVGRQLFGLPDNLCYESDGDDDVGGDQGCLTRRMKYLSNVIDMFWKRWKNSTWLSCMSHIVTGREAPMQIQL